ncbi:MAG: hypothetical protein IPJ61_20615 [Tessaracoccus sp.]|uniref:hypothetical protein n=1 Tax=Tessaracoccus sp. TaxID=1971211 RepID=UPI001EC16089|nr:hypothetical protein [Tessaracoccus sp.]MBK7823392.1 hypothetical protein [Tessaracoccus sp.]
MSSISWFRLPRGRVWHVALGARALCGEYLPFKGGEWQQGLPPNGARVCSECNDADERIGQNIAQAMRRSDVPLPLGDDQVVDAEIVDAEFDTNDVAVIREARMISFGPYSNEGSSESAFSFVGARVVAGTVTGSIEVEDVDGRLAAQIRGGNVEGMSTGPYAGFNSEGDEIIVDQEGVPYRPVPDGAIADLAQQLREARNQP